MQTIARALLSVSDKTGIVELAAELSGLGVELISTGGTARAIREAGIAVKDVSDITGFPEVMDGRVKTLHPAVHGGLLARLDDPTHRAAMDQHNIQSIDLAIINLYPFQQTVSTPGATHDEIIEQIDIGGPAMVRASAKNYRFTGIVVNPERYGQIIQELRDNAMCISDATRLELAHEAFQHTASYDAMIAEYFSRATSDSPTFQQQSLHIDLPLAQTLRYGENPHQTAALYGGFNSIFRQLHGKELSYNNILDIDAAAKLVIEFQEPTVVIVKHNNPCGVGSGATLIEAWQNAYTTDTTSAFGGIVAVNRPLDMEAALAINEIFTEVIIAPEYPEEVLERLRKKKDRRLIAADYQALAAEVNGTEPELRTVAGGLLAQSRDNALVDSGALRTVTERQPTETEMQAMMYAWRVAKHVKSNAIVYAAPNRTLGIGAGQMSRVDSAITAARKAQSAGLELSSCAVASDAFFPFADGLMEAVQAGATAVIQPGGSVRDQEVIDAANSNNITMMLTGMRHFRH
ncbi:MAG: bifunctional phosphoribosylaminoimidazolecarboxamide formyltransferase/IMP cyclohydrolase [Armatimonadetes bacterium]|nr:bifunctional phosphoribosylaminoimidazolecarboxamide formyltransferase/IMP cyclohydrolase [Armatimonadota bacterium]